MPVGADGFHVRCRPIQPQKKRADLPCITCKNFELPDDAYVLEPGHDAWVIGDEAAVGYEFEGPLTGGRAAAGT